MNKLAINTCTQSNSFIRRCPLRPRIVGETLSYAPNKQPLHTQGEQNRILSFVKSLLFRTSKEQELSNEESVFIKPRKIFGIPAGNHIMYNKKRVGFVDFEIRDYYFDKVEEYPRDWFSLANAFSNHAQLQLLKPLLWVSELFMYDRVKSVDFMQRDKKYGAMLMKQLLRIANESGCEDRIALKVEALPGARFQPGNFYNKMGFSPGVGATERKRAIELMYRQQLLMLLEKGYDERQAKLFLEAQGLRCPEIVDGRYIPEYELAILTNPECIRNYVV